MTRPQDEPGVLVVVLAVVAVVAILIFAAYVLGGWRLFHRELTSVKPALALAAVGAVCVGALLVAVKYDEAQRDAAWDRYDEWRLQQMTQE